MKYATLTASLLSFMNNFDALKSQGYSVEVYAISTKEWHIHRHISGISHAALTLRGLIGMRKGIV